MKSTPIAVACTMAVLSLAQGSALAEDGGPQLKVSGYGTLAAVMTNDSTRQFTADITRSVGATKTPDFGQDSRLGLQGVVNFQNRFSVTAQVVAQRRLTYGSALGGDKDFSPAVDWLYAQYDATTEFNARLGRMALPTYLLSDSLRVGYAANWLRAPIHLYVSEPITTFDGAELNYRRSFGGYNISAQALHGKAKATMAQYPSPVLLDSSNVNGLNLSVDHGNWLGRVGIVRASLPVGFAGTTLKLQDSYISVGMQYDDGQLLVMSEFAKRHQNKQEVLGGKPIGVAQYGYVAAGWRVGKFLPMAMYSVTTSTSNFPFGGTVLTFKAHNFAPSLSLRYDVVPNVALKAQFDRYQAKDPVAFQSLTPADNRKINVYSVGLDFVF